MDGDQKPKLSSDIHIPFYTEKDAEVAYNSLRVDKEPPRGGCVRTLTVEGNILAINFTATDPKKLRVAINSILDSVSLIAETIQQFGSSSDI